MPLRYKQFQRLIIIIISLITIILIISYPKQSLSAALNGLNTWLNVVLPSLLPFFIVSDIMIQLGLVDFLSTILNPIMKPFFNCPGHSSFVWVMSMASGYPMGAKLVASLYEEGSITKIEGQRMLAFCNTSGPLFMIGAVGIGMLGRPKAGKIIAFSHYASAFILGLLFRFYGRQKTNDRIYSAKPRIKAAFRELLMGRSKSSKSLGMILGDSVKKSMESQVLIGGFIILFSVIINLLIPEQTANSPSLSSSNWVFTFPRDWQLIKPLGAGILEITTGCQLLGDSIVDYKSKLIAASFIIGWGGFSIHSQAISLLANTDLSIGLYLFSKFLHGLFAAGITYIYIMVSSVESIPAFSSYPSTFNITITSTFVASLQLLASAIFSFLALYLMAILIKVIKQPKS
ncbi:MAG: sporulation integral membrane protein YlbJ [Clostridiales bacterium]|mgnify:CR=1 FL=1|nr:sporulation integral membrane protein YlbJ [Clostridiales bacterium]